MEPLEESVPASSPTLLPLSGGNQRTLRFAVDLRVLNKRPAPRIPGFLRNLSTTGAFIETVPERVGGIFDLEFAFPGQQGRFHVLSRIVWCRKVHEAKAGKNRPLGMGVKFLRFLKGEPLELKRLLETWDRLHHLAQERHRLSLVEEERMDEGRTSREKVLYRIPCDLREDEIEAILGFLTDKP